MRSKFDANVVLDLDPRLIPPQGARADKVLLDVFRIPCEFLSENVIYNQDGAPFNGQININDGKLETSDLIVTGDSLLLGADLTSKAFSRSIFGVYGQYIVAIGLLLFAFSTAIAWSYYGDRATVHLFGEGWIIYYRIIYVGAFFTAAVIDTKIVWDIATVIGPIATVPNLLAILFLRKEIKKLDTEYVIRD